jgi:hypothetical protein
MEDASNSAVNTMGGASALINPSRSQSYMQAASPHCHYCPYRPRYSGQSNGWPYGDRAAFFRNPLCSPTTFKERAKYLLVEGSCMQFIDSYQTVRDIVHLPALHAYFSDMEE